jgi:DNA invertase Pin-like site-specific DNA recombinase
MTMSLPWLPSKIRPEHRERSAWIYVRQSSLGQVRDHPASAARQYDLRERALALGWTREQVQVVDEDQGVSGRAGSARDGFERLVAQVGLGQVGAVFCLEASRLARSCSAWYRLLEICALTDTLVIDADGIYDPGEYNDRLLLGFKATMSEAELHWLHQRLVGGKLEKARQGTLRQRLPTGFTHDPTGRVVFDPDEAVQEAVRLALEQFEQCGTALGVVRYFAQHGLQFPARRWEGRDLGELRWRPLSLTRLLSLLHNPVYAGAYVYGRTAPYDRHRGAGRRGTSSGGFFGEEPIVLQDAHAGYLSWEQFQRNQQRLADNATASAPPRRGATREGAALLQGIAVCGRCGRRMTVHYQRGRSTPGYRCLFLRTQHGGDTCQCLEGAAVDAAVARVLLEALQPAQLTISLATLDQIEARERQVERQWELRRERAQYEADLARRRFLAVEPENRLVARTLEREWNEALAAVAQVEQAAAERPALALRRMSAADREKILALAGDLPAVWHAPTTTHAERKQLLRCLIEDVTLTRCEETIQVGIHWQTGAATEIAVPRPRMVWELQQIDPAVLQQIRALAAHHTDREIAARLNATGHTSGSGRAFTGDRVWQARHRAGIPTGCAEAPREYGDAPRGDGRISVRSAAQQLQVHPSTVIAWCRSGRLDGVQAVPHGPWWVRLTPERLALLRGGAEETRRETAQEEGS